MTDIRYYVTHLLVSRVTPLCGGYMAPVSHTPGIAGNAMPRKLLAARFAP